MYMHSNFLFIEGWELKRFFVNLWTANLETVNGKQSLTCSGIRSDALYIPKIRLGTMTYC
jgi:hypothetical protein